MINIMNSVNMINIMTSVNMINIMNSVMNYLSHLVEEVKHHELLNSFVYFDYRLYEHNTGLSTNFNKFLQHFNHSQFYVP